MEKKPFLMFFVILVCPVSQVKFYQNVLKRNLLHTVDVSIYDDTGMNQCCS